jgi:hypothetical protein
MTNIGTSIVLRIDYYFVGPNDKKSLLLESWMLDILATRLCQEIILSPTNALWKEIYIERRLIHDNFHSDMWVVDYIIQAWKLIFKSNIFWEIHLNQHIKAWSCQSRNISQSTCPSISYHIYMARTVSIPFSTALQFLVGACLDVKIFGKKFL